MGRHYVTKNGKEIKKSQLSTKLKSYIPHTKEMYSVMRVIVFTSLCLALILCVTIKSSATQDTSCSDRPTKFIGESCEVNFFNGGCFFGSICIDGICKDVFKGIFRKLKNLFF